MVSYQSAKEEIKRTADVVELIGQYVKLRKAGRNYMGLCPFHAEKDPSFTVNSERGTFHCFGCKKGGDIFAFWMEYHSTTFPEAMRDLADRYHITITEGYSEADEKKKAVQRDTLYKINEISADYFQKALSHSVKGKPAREYLKRRAISKEIISEFRLGYAPDEWDGLIKVLKSLRVDINMAVQAGVAIQKEKGGYYDRFRGRVIFPIYDQRQRVVGFGGRVLDDSLPKYLNTPETKIFHKGEAIYGLHASFKGIREKGRAVIVEGYMDWLALKKHGLEEAVATLGTALTDRHVRKLKGYAKESIIVFDSDDAGKSAALKSLHVFANEGLPAKAVVLPAGHDPDSFVNEKGLDQFLDLLDNASPMFDFFLEQKLTEGDSAEAKVQALKEMLPVLSEIRDFTLRSLYVRRLSDKIGIREDVTLSELKAHMKNSIAGVPKKRINASQSDSEKKKASVGDLQLLNLLVYYPDTIPRLMACECKAFISDPEVINIVDIIFEEYLQRGAFSPEDLLESLSSVASRERLMETLHRPFIIYSDQDAEQAVAEFEKKAYQKKISASFRKAKGDWKTQNQLLKKKIQGPIGS
ncbi:MAG: DNA primase [Deltaproteobacteria bacterium]|nr:DNA primase [Deltaproteobacteria bacterium]